MQPTAQLQLLSDWLQRLILNWWGLNPVSNYSWFTLERVWKLCELAMGQTDC